MKRLFDLAVLHRRIQSYLRAHALATSDHERVGCFVARFDGRSDNPYRNYAVPDDDAEPKGDEISALVAAFVRRGRKPRLEYIAAAAPGVESALRDAGFTVERRIPLMICREVQPAGLPLDGVQLAIARSDADTVEAADVGARAYGNDGPSPDSLRELIERGGVLAIARDGMTGAMIGAGVATPQQEAVTEITGIGVLAAFRRRGLAGALTSLLARESFARGANLAWLTPEHDEARNIYARTGFVSVSEQLHISKQIGPAGTGHE
jgi:ribosomal protein S18 acetylase RimI-like enzyme